MLVAETGRGPLGLEVRASQSTIIYLSSKNKELSEVTGSICLLL